MLLHLFVKKLIFTVDADSLRFYTLFSFVVLHGMGERSKFTVKEILAWNNSEFTLSLPMFLIELKLYHFLAIFMKITFKPQSIVK